MSYPTAGCDGRSGQDRRWARLVSAVLGATLACVTAMPTGAAQETLAPVVNAGERVLRFDWPDIRIGTGEYEEGPTGVTVFHFAHRALAAVDVRGGAPGTVNTDYLRLGYDEPELDAIVFAGGSWYGLEATTAVGTALKDDGLRDGDFTNIALSVGAIIYDLGPRRLNEIYPDKRLAQAAYRAARPGVFPLGAQGAGRFAMTGYYFGCAAYSGQGGAYRQIGEVKIAAFVVANAYGVVTGRDGRPTACYRDPAWPADLKTSDLLAAIPASRSAGWSGAAAPANRSRNTTISLVVTNQKMTPDELQRLATQVHTSMGRGLQPFATVDDGDVLYAVSTAEVDARAGQHTLSPIDLDTAASEVMWDAILSSVPEQPVAPKPTAGSAPALDQLAPLVGDYAFSPIVKVHVSVDGQRLMAQATGLRAAYAIGRGAPVELKPVSASEFVVPGRYPMVLLFDRPGELVINPGHWAQVGVRAQP
jgi:L-aminopeptidase/D-esterase-like protein